jgi:hypothetical protein
MINTRKLELSERTEITDSNQVQERENCTHKEQKNGKEKLFYV